MKKWSVIIATVMAILILAVSSVSALAQTDDGTGDSNKVRIDGLAIVAPLVVPVDTKISITVFKCSDQEPIKGAGVWLVTKDKLEILKKEMAAVRGSNSLSAERNDYEDLLGVHGTLLSRTDEDGKVWHSFENAGRYILVATLRGFVPDHRQISVGMLPKALAIDAPRIAEVGEKVTITVYKRGTEDPVKDAGVWAFTREQAESLKADLIGIRDSSDSVAIDTVVEKACSVHGINLGTTNGAGKVTHAFENAGVYILLARKSGFSPGWKSIAIGMKPKALAIDAPRKAEVDEKVTITVYQRGIEDAVKDAGVWAFTRKGAESLKADVASVRESGDQDAIEAAIEEACNIHGIFLGTTNGAGKVTHAFDEAGGYLLIAVKKGYFPSWRPIVIVNPAAIGTLERPSNLDEKPDNRPGLK